YRFVTPRSCGGGSPRITLLIDANGDGQFNQVPSGPDFAIHGHVNPPATAGCVSGPAGPSFPNAWRIEDLTDDMNRWEVTPGSVATTLGIPTYPYSPWETMETAVTTAFPNHKVLSGFLVDDSCSFFPAACG